MSVVATTFSVVKDKRLLVILQFGRRAPSGVVRVLIYDEWFRRAGFKARYMDHYKWIGMYVRGFNRIYRLISEWRILRFARQADVVYMSKVTDRHFMERLRRVTRARLVLDFGDALWLRDKQQGNEFARTLSLVDAVTTDNEYTARYVRQYNANCTVISDCPQVEKFDAARSGKKRRSDESITIGWVGSPSTTYNLYVVWEALEKLFEKFPHLHLRLVGADPRRLPPFEKVRYSMIRDYDQARMVEEVYGMDIGLFPLQDVEASRVRGVLKATVYMSGEVVAVCSPVGQCLDLVQDGVNGVLAGDTPEWIAKIEHLIVNPVVRKSIAAAGLQTVREQFTVAKSFERLHRVLADSR